MTLGDYIDNAINQSTPNDELVLLIIQTFKGSL